MVEKVTALVQTESVRLDSDRLGGLYSQLGDAGAEDVVCRAIEELAVRLSACERHWRRQDWAGLRKCARSLIAIADQIGMVALARVAGDVTHTVDNADYVASAATLYRLIRVGERSLTAVWDLQDLSI
ncbi:hypothetical protein ACFORG_05790 [Lutimaribacter marinistellae]|uniref:Hpt domain-containing protein n=1 Tax=Lutimaribacter marinistellae TaxID=1820329 RepID=A0ABV7TDA5_9RHOB